jgi:hypothetical protein
MFGLLRRRLASTISTTATPRRSSPTLLQLQPFPLHTYIRFCPLTTLGTPEDRSKYPVPPPVALPVPGRPRSDDPLEDLKHVHMSSSSNAAEASSSASDPQEDAVREEAASTFLHVLEERDPLAPCPMCANGEAHTCPELGTYDDARDEAYVQAEGPEVSGIKQEERKRIVQARARIMDDEKAPCMILEQHRLQEQMEEEARCVREDASQCLVEDKEAQAHPREGEHYRRAGQMRVTREPGPGDVKSMLETSGYGSHGHRESGKGYGDVAWEGGVPMFLTKDGATQLFVEGAAGQTKVEMEVGQGAGHAVREALSPGAEASPCPKEIHSNVLRTLKEEGEMDSLRRVGGPGGQLANERYTRPKTYGNEAEWEGAGGTEEMNLKEGSDGGEEEGTKWMDLKNGGKEEGNSVKVEVEVAKKTGKVLAEGVQKAVDSTVVRGRKGVSN